ncbi:predicted protein [Lichtheimia corymbifera JMRC:FSU:9682]|uniref:Uncharacterized protein n=1 Tax=Lichtheimia corymbifera JMRC:FSU:9682 TaxID=1263082 RepID=A0A068RL42_9FUNG|nr:predicted protein [Lichtheimia corymbifera JMRC:FSU:9682]
MTPEIPHMELETFTQGTLGHADQFHSHKVSMIHYVRYKEQVPACLTDTKSVMELFDGNDCVETREHYRQGDYAHGVDSLLRKWDHD